MDRNTIVRIAIPLSLYESVKGKVLNEAKKPIDAAKKKAAEKKAADIKKKKEADAKKVEAEKKKAAEAKKKAKA